MLGITWSIDLSSMIGIFPVKPVWSLLLYVCVYVVILIFIRMYMYTYTYMYIDMDMDIYNYGHPYGYGYGYYSYAYGYGYVHVCKYIDRHTHILTVCIHIHVPDWCHSECFRVPFPALGFVLEATCLRVAPCSPTHGATTSLGPLEPGAMQRMGGKTVDRRASRCFWYSDVLCSCMICRRQRLTWICSWECYLRSCE